MSLTYRFLRRQDDSAPLLVLLPAEGETVSTAIAAGRRLWPGAPAVGLRWRVPTGEDVGIASREPDLADELAYEAERAGSLIEEVARSREMALVELVLVGAGYGADFATALLRRRPGAYSAAILFGPRVNWPMAAPSHQAMGSGPEVLILCSARGIVPASATQRWLTAVGVSVTLRTSTNGDRSLEMEELARLWLRQHLRDEIEDDYYTPTP